MTQPEIKVVPTPAEVAAEAAQRVVRAADEAIALAGRFSLALAGGSTPRLLYQHLASTHAAALDWTKVQIFFGDERCVPPDHPESNFHMARETLLDRLPIPSDNIHRMRGEIDPEEAAKAYGLMLKQMFPDEDGLDLILLGMGDDGHTASLFPGTEAVRETHHRCVANFAEHSTTGRSWRITLTAPFINRSRRVVILVAGAGKAATLARVLEGSREPERFPVQLIDPTSGNLTWLVDAAAAGMGQGP